MAIIEIACDSWLDLKARGLPKLYSNNPFIRGRFYFRGQSSDSFGLESSFDRWHKNAGLGINKASSEKKIIDLFKEELRNSQESPAISQSDEEILALAQHYGTPTRLLDWSESPYIAAFFAFANLTSSPTPDARVAIWCIDTTNSLWTDDKGIKLVSVSSPYNLRLKSQLGKFTLLQSPFDTVEQHIEHCKISSNIIWKITIPVSEGNAALSDLDFMGVNYSTIYHGVEGCARAAMIRMLLEQQQPKRTSRKTVTKRTKRRTARRKVVKEATTEVE